MYKHATLSCSFFPSPGRKTVSFTNEIYSNTWAALTRYLGLGICTHISPKTHNGRPLMVELLEHRNPHTIILSRAADVLLVTVKAPPDSRVLETWRTTVAVHNTLRGGQSVSPVSPDPCCCVSTLFFIFGDLVSVCRNGQVT